MARKWLKRPLHRLNRLEHGWVSETLPDRAPARWLVRLSLATRGGLLWWAAAAALTVVPGRSRRAGLHAAAALALATPSAHLLGRVALR
ncbi:hypothetical protein FNH07_36710, partial [Amycolatopsis bartoniae]